ncbi:restriction endonuclease [Alteromonas sp. 345S023]|uniref:Restriction endonuclease n=1 Tax=Alteromonas profundi TaxID=2696062 RepID=A0A7X5RMK2_9ALTE|nr:restriction endonuclease [Alteromonas profundi]NDV93092.1 restriction endonuclease [Alteromonas profundi]
MYTVITENDESKWADETGALYHFPKRYEKHLIAGTQVLYYKGKLKKIQYRNVRLSDSPHYFGVARVGKVYKDGKSSRGDLFATIIEYSPFEEPVLAKIDGGYLEQIPASKKVNYWRDGVRPINKRVFESVCDRADIVTVTQSNKEDYSPFNDVDGRLESGEEGKQSKRYITAYFGESERSFRFYPITFSSSFSSLPVLP